MTVYSMTPIKSGTRLRTGHDVFASVIVGDLSPADTLLGNQVWTCPVDGVEARKNDKWLYVTHQNGVELEEKGWVAIVHKGVPICNNFKEVGTTPPVDPAPVGFPQSVVWEYIEPSTGKTHRLNYVFDKEV